MLPSVSAAPLTALPAALTTPRIVSLLAAVALTVEAAAVAAAVARASTSLDEATLDRYEREAPRLTEEEPVEAGGAVAAALAGVAAVAAA